MASSIPTRKQAEATVYALVQSNIVADLNTRMTSLEKIGMLSAADQSTLEAAFVKAGWTCTNITENVPVFNADGTTSFVQTVFLKVV